MVKYASSTTRYRLLMKKALAFCFRVYRIDAMNNEFNTGTMDSLGHGSIGSNVRLQVGNNYTYNYNTIVGSNMALGTPHQQTPAQEVMEYANFLRSLSYPEMEYRFHNVDDVQDDTCRWLLSHSYYREWHSGPGSTSLLMIRGKPGSRKSIAMKRAYKLARKKSPANEAVIAFFFNSRGISMETKLEGFFRSTLHQLLESRDSTNNDAFTEWKRKNSLIRSGWAWIVKELKDIFETCVVRSTVKITMFVDALGQCESPSAARDQRST
ncbi:hypothetical protein DER44DRAFT_851736 [Fusarium oxysporum]|nr:hypothetical protein DER44DRAFT_851736 [Fusarium oxysporum]